MSIPNFKKFLSEDPLHDTDSSDSDYNSDEESTSSEESTSREESTSSEREDYSTSKNKVY